MVGKKRIEGDLLISFHHPVNPVNPVNVFSMIEA